MNSRQPNLGAEAIALLPYVQSAFGLSDRDLNRLRDRLWVFSAYIRQPRKDDGKCNVGHILPLTRGGKHSWDNIAWMSDDGNRIQGNDTLEEIEAKLVKAVEYHLRRDMASGQPPQIFHSKVQKLWILLNDIRDYLGKSNLPW